jgi:3,4-dihydroxy 2-butanone 4-phosphate synthase/GTP cyclohydrolase II
MSATSGILVRTVSARIPTDEGEFQLCHYTNTRDNLEHLALVLGDVQDAEGLLVRVHSECFTGDVLGSRRCDCGDQLHQAMQAIADAGRGAVIYLRQEGRGIGLSEKLRAYNLQDEGYDTVEANLLLGHQADERDYWAAAAILAELRVRSINLLTNNPSKIELLRELGVEITGRTAVHAPINVDNRDYLATKARRMRHMLALPVARAATDAADSSVAGHWSEAVDEALRGLRAACKRHAAEQSERRPFVTLTYAQSLDGSIAARPGEALTLSGAESLRLTHTLRTMHDAILVGVGTVLADDPSLTVRMVEGAQPQPVVLDSALRVPDSARLLQHPRAPRLAAVQPDPVRRTVLEARGAQVLEVAAHEDKVNLHVLLEELAARGVRSVMVEGGAQVIGEFLAQRLVDAVIVTIAPRYVGGLQAVAPAAAAPAAPASAAAPGSAASASNGQRALLPRLIDPLYTQVGADLVVWGIPVWEEELVHDPSALALD